MLIFGAGEAGELIVRDMLRRGDYDPIAFIDDDPQKLGRRICGVPVLGGRRDLPSILEQAEPEELLVAVPSAEPSAIERVVRSAESAHVHITTLPAISELTHGNVTVGHIRALAVEDLLPRAPVGLDTKRVRAFIAGRRVMVTGAGGSIGSELCRQIARMQPSSLVMLERHENSLHELMLTIDCPVAHPFLGDVLDAPRLEQAFAEHAPELIFHAAAHKHVPLIESQVCEGVRNNVGGTRAVVAAAVSHGTKTCVLISSDKAVNPSSVMGATKRITEMIMRERNAHKTELVTVRFGNVMDSNGSVLRRFREQIRAGGPVTVTHPDMRRYFMLIPEAVQLVLQAAALGGSGSMYLLDMGEPMHVLDLARLMIRLSGSIPENEIAIEFTGLRAGEKLDEELIGADEWAEPTSVAHTLSIRSSGPQPLRLDEQLTLLEAAARRGDAAETLALLQRLIPTFVPAR